MLSDTNLLAITSQITIILAITSKITIILAIRSQITIILAITPQNNYHFGYSISKFNFILLYQTQH